jgi:hypothetical protein
MLTMLQWIGVLNTGGPFGDAAMFGNVKQSSPFGGILIDTWNERPLVIALATIILLWAMVFALTLV